LWTLAGGSLAGGNAEGSLATDHILALGDTVSVSVLHESHSAATPAGMLLRLAIGIGSTQETATWTHATSFQTGQITGAIVVAQANGLYGAALKDAATLVRISGIVLGADALVATLLVHTVGSIGAGQMGALVLIRAAQQRISLESRLAHTLRWIRGCTLGIDATRESFTGALAFVIVLGIQEVGRWANTLSRLDALLITGTLLISSTFPLCHSAQSIVGISLVSFGAVATITSWCIYALSSKGA